MPDRPQRPPPGLQCEALVWRRYDFRESSRIVVLLSREHGRLQALAKGAHRPNSPLLGRLDFLNELNVRLSADRGGLREARLVEVDPGGAPGQDTGRVGRRPAVADEDHGCHVPTLVGRPERLA